jgi:hypothetical protein
MVLPLFLFRAFAHCGPALAACSWRARGRPRNCIGTWLARAHVGRFIGSSRRISIYTARHQCRTRIRIRRKRPSRRRRGRRGLARILGRGLVAPKLIAARVATHVD